GGGCGGGGWGSDCGCAARGSRSLPTGSTDSSSPRTRWRPVRTTPCWTRSGPSSGAPASRRGSQPGDTARRPGRLPGRRTDEKDGVMSPAEATFNFTGQVVCVSGGATGIGAASAMAFAAAGARVIVADVAADDAHRTVSDIIAAGGDARYSGCDVADAGAVGAMVEDILATEGRLDVVHANAGLESMKAATDVSLAEWHRVVGVNLTGVFLICRAGLRHMYRQGSGVLVITSSPHALATVPDAAAYAASKGGVHALTRALALEAAPHGIRVNALVPGTVDTPMVRREIQVAADPDTQLTP